MHRRDRALDPFTMPRGTHGTPWATNVPNKNAVIFVLELAITTPEWRAGLMRNDLERRKCGLDWRGGCPHSFSWKPRNHDNGGCGVERTAQHLIVGRIAGRAMEPLCSPHYGQKSEGGSLRVPGTLLKQEHCTRAHAHVKIDPIV